MGYHARSALTGELKRISGVSEDAHHRIEAAARAQRLVLLLPPVEDEGSCPKVFQEFQQLRALTPKELDWVVDLSRQHCLPLPLIRLFASMADEFRHEGRHFILTGAAPGLLPPEDYTLHPFRPEEQSAGQP